MASAHRLAKGCRLLNRCTLTGCLLNGELSAGAHQKIMRGTFTVNSVKAREQSLSGDLSDWEGEYIAPLNIEKRRPIILLSHAFQPKPLATLVPGCSMLGNWTGAGIVCISDLSRWKGLCYIDNMLVMGEGDDLGCPPKLSQNLK